MEKDLSNYRKSYNKGELLLNNSPENPLELFKNWFMDVDANFPEEETNAMTLATIGQDGFPKSRVVLLKKYTSEGFIFYTNYNSEKGKAIEANANICLSFFWASAERQIIIKGKAEKIKTHLSDSYFKSRPHGSQLGAIVSKQSEIIENRQFLEDALEKLEASYKNKPIKRPEHWGGYIAKPVSIEFWQGRANRLHDRIVYSLNTDNEWVKNRLSP